ncbi:hypothetical protein MKW98_019527 [Papaver atlanticum]|uniref:Uncharacterized protein n=1 Tax=Papaver atlanticum TaxID=357466 RepID=A0AAD4XA64_9MAGN|nr:hypothetical protein MKW98_019527 [Papaver atlanticum]
MQVGRPADWKINMDGGESRESRSICLHTSISVVIVAMSSSCYYDDSDFLDYRCASPDSDAESSGLVSVTKVATVFSDDKGVEHGSKYARLGFADNTIRGPSGQSKESDIEDITDYDPSELVSVSKEETEFLGKLSVNISPYASFQHTG